MDTFGCELRHLGGCGGKLEPFQMISHIANQLKWLCRGIFARYENNP